jgi:GDP-L-fucose synthase
MTDPFPTSGVSFFRGKRVCVTGASGLIGSYAVKLLKESGAWVRAVVHSRPVNDFTLLADEVVSRNLRSPDDTHAAIEHCDAVVGCAGITGGVNMPNIDPVSFVGPATALVINTLHACHEEKVPAFGFLSSTTVYAPSERPVREEYAEQSDAIYPLYRGIGHSKRWLEKLCRYYHETTGLGVAVVRPAGAYGRFDNFDEKTSHVLPGLVTRALRHDARQPFEVWGDGESIRDIIHAQDVARCFLLALANLQTAEPVNVASGRGITTGDLAREVLAAVGCPANLMFDTTRPSALNIRLVDVSKADKLLNFRSEISLEKGLADVVAWRRENP